MLVARQCEIGRNDWFSNNLQALYNSEHSRMSNTDLLSSRPDWREQYSSFHFNEEPSSDSPSHLPCSFSNGSFLTLDQDGSRFSVDQQQNDLAKLDHRAQVEPGTNRILWNSREESHPSKPPESNHPLVSSDSVTASLPPTRLNPLGSTSCISTESVKATNDDDAVEVEIKNEDDELDYDDEMIDADFEEGVLPKTDAERRAERRKMKRFRLTHQQTRFLMSEFAKQAHPDAAHRERLSKEIPGLSPRQVQVWFQNRRAKIKRLTADDRDRMIKMRAVPENFDNIKALHSPYGAVHSLGSPIKSPVDFGPYSEQLMRPLIIDSTRNNHEGHVSPTASSPAFSHAGFGSNSLLRSPDILSASTSMTSPDGYYSNHIPSPMSAGPRGTISYSRQNNVLSPSQSCHPRHVVRCLQPSQLRETVSKLRPDSLQSPLRLSMSWKGENLNYNDFNPTEQMSPHYGGHKSSVDQQEIPGNRDVDSRPYENNTYSNTSNIESSPTNIFPSLPSATTFMDQSNLLSISRMRAASTNTFPSTLDLRNQFQTRNTPPLITPQSNSFGNAFSANYLNTPPTAFINSPQQEFIDTNSPKLSEMGPEQIDEKSLDAKKPSERSPIESPDAC